MRATWRRGVNEIEWLSGLDYIKSPQIAARMGQQEERSDADVGCQMSDVSKANPYFVLFRAYFADRL